MTGAGKTTGKAPAGGPGAQRSPEEERQRRRSKHGLVREREARPFAAGGDALLGAWFRSATVGGERETEAAIEREEGDEERAEPREPASRLGHHLAQVALTATAESREAHGNGMNGAGPAEAAPTSTAAAAPAIVIAPSAAPASGLLDVSEPGDTLEREADQAAERVLHRIAVAPGGAGAPPPEVRTGAGARLQRSSLVEVIAEATGRTPRTETPGGLIVEDNTETLTPGR